MNLSYLKMLAACLQIDANDKKLLTIKRLHDRNKKLTDPQKASIKLFYYAKIIQKPKPIIIEIITWREPFVTVNAGIASQNKKIIFIHTTYVENFYTCQSVAGFRLLNACLKKVRKHELINAPLTISTNTIGIPKAIESSHWHFDYVKSQLAITQRLLAQFTESVKVKLIGANYSQQIKEIINWKLLTRGITPSEHIFVPMSLKRLKQIEQLNQKL